MDINMYALSLEHFVKSYVDFKSAETAKERDSYDKMITKFVLEFTRMSAPKRVWGVDRADLIDDMRYAVDKFASYGLIGISGKAFGFRCKDGDFRILFADCYESYVKQLDEIPTKFSSSFIPISDFVELSEVRGDHVITLDGERIDLEYRLLDSIVNTLDRVYERSDNL